MAGNVKQKMAAIFFALVLVFTPAFFAVLPAPVSADQHEAAAGGDAPADGGGGDQAPVEPTDVGDIDANESNTSFFTDPIGALQTAGRAIVNLFLLSIAGILLQIISFIGYLFSLAIEILKWALTYRGYATQSEVGVGWSIVRDIINSFFIVVLIAIAISTIIRFQPYNFRSTLPRLIVAALLVNLSRTICLLAISFADSVMRTFGTQLIDILPVYVLGLRLPAITALGSESIGGVFGSINSANLTKEPLDIVTILVSIIIAIIMMVFALGGLVMFCIILVFRILVLWFLMILSPLAFFLWGAPGRAASYWGQWLEEFIKHVIVGPVGAFFLYIIALFYVNNLQNSYGFSPSQSLPPSVSTVAADPQIFVGYLISLGMMFIALEIIEQMGVRGGRLARDVSGIDNFASLLKKTPKSLLGAAASTYSLGADLVTKRTGIPVGLLKPWQAWEGVKGGLQDKRERIAIDAERKQASTLAWLSERGGLGAAAYGYLSGNRGFVKGESFGNLKSRLVATLGFGRVERGSLDQLKTQGQAYRDDSKSKLVYQNLSAEQQGVYGGMTRAKLLEVAGNFDRYGKLAGLRNQLKQTERLRDEALESGDRVREAELNAQINALNPQINEARAAIGDAYDETAYADVARVQGIDQNGDKLKAMSEALKSSKGDIGIGNTIAGSISQKDATWEGRGERSIKELKRRQKDVQVARAASRADIMDKIKDYVSQNFERDVKYDLEDLYSQLRSNDNRDNREKFAGDLLQAAKQGNADDVLLRLNPKFTATIEGRAAVVDHLEQELGFERQDALNIISEMQGRNAGANKLADTGWVRMDGLTKDFELVKKDQRKQIIKNRTEGQSLEDMLRKFGRDGLGYKDPITNKYVADEGISERLKLEDFTPIITNDTTLGRIPRNTKQFLVDNAEKFGIKKEHVDILNENLKQG